jgi:hypothetical protein
MKKVRISQKRGEKTLVTHREDSSGEFNVVLRTFEKNNKTELNIYSGNSALFLDGRQALALKSLIERHFSEKK